MKWAFITENKKGRDKLHVVARGLSIKRKKNE